MFLFLHSFSRVITAKFCYELKTIHKLYVPVWYNFFHWNTSVDRNCVIHYLTKVSAQKLNGSFNKGLHHHSLVYHKLRIWVMNFSNVVIIETIIYFHKSNKERLHGLAGTTLCNLNGFLVFHYKIIVWNHNLSSFYLFFSWHFILLELALKVRVIKVWIFLLHSYVFTVS